MKDLLKNLDAYLPEEENKRKWFAVGITVLLSDILTIIGIFGIGVYGMALFLLTPFFIGMGPVLLLGRKKTISKKEAFKLGLITLGIFVATLIVFAIEGLICITMAAPLGLGLVWLGSIVGHRIVSKTPNNTTGTYLLIFLSIPAFSFIEKDQTPSVVAVVSSIEINASPDKVWKNVIAFPRLKEPEEFIFKTGIAYPIDAQIKGDGVGAVRYCNFTTGSFVEPITVWDQPNLLKFDVVEQPEPMRELNFWDINAPHLHDYFVSKQGQFKIIKLENGKTKLEGTTWYYHKISPRIYWQLWSDYIIHKIHFRVLDHIKVNSEKK